MIYLVAAALSLFALMFAWACCRMTGESEVTVESKEPTTVTRAFKRMRARTTNVLVIVEGEDSVRIVNEGTLAELTEWRYEAHKVAGVFNGDTSLTDLRESVRQVASELSKGVAA